LGLDSAGAIARDVRISGGCTTLSANEDKAGSPRVMGRLVHDEAGCDGDGSTTGKSAERRRARKIGAKICENQKSVV
jgi:hypothetical protein